MRNLILFITILGINAHIFSQEIAGSWKGALQVQNINVRLIFNLDNDDTQWSGTLDSPDEGLEGIKLSHVEIQDSIVKVEIAKLDLVYEGVWDGADIISGTFRQMNQEFSLQLDRVDFDSQAVPLRPQKPSPPFSYHAEEVTFISGDGMVTLGGTLCIPDTKKKYAAVILITGSGPQDRDETIMGHKPFWVIADYLATRGLAVLRFDDRGVGASSGTHETSTTHDFVKDVEGAITYLQEHANVDSEKIGLIGHSEGALIGALAAASRKEVAALVLMAGPGVPMDELLLMQKEAMLEAAGISDPQVKLELTTARDAFDIIMTTEDEDRMTEKLRAYFLELMERQQPDQEPNEDLIALQVRAMTTPWMRNLLVIDPAEALGQVHCPVLAINGEKDLQVPAGPNLSRIEDALNKNGKIPFTAKSYPGLNHLFQECSTGLMTEYARIEQTFAPHVMEDMSRWLTQNLVE